MITGDNLELLAPAGTMEVLESAIKAGADAVYLGGKKFNMRMLRAECNFSDDELRTAVDYVHNQGKKIYITLNNMYYDDEIDRIGEYLRFLSGLGIDALIVQDLAVVELCKELNIKIPLHASVQMGIANLEAVRYLEQLDFKRVILSRNLSLQEINNIASQTKIGIEHFVHGEQCVSHTGQCYMSSFTSGESGNRGQCTKPCRWEYQLNGAEGSSLEGYQYFLAYKDLCLYPHLVDLIKAGVISFKIEGRARRADYVGYLVSKYRKALDNIRNAPESYRVDDSEYQDLMDKRIRDYSTGSIYGGGKRDDVGFDGHREPPFSTAPRSLPTLGSSDYQDYSHGNKIMVPELTVKINNPEDIRLLGKHDVSHIIIGMDQIRQHSYSWDGEQLARAKSMVAETQAKILIETPRIVNQNDLDGIYELRDAMVDGPFYGVVVNDLGSMNIFRDTGLAIWGGYGLKTANRRAAQSLGVSGAERITASLELDAYHLKTMLDSGVDTELLVHGPLCGMITDYCLPRAVHNDTREDCSLHCLVTEYALQDRYGQKYKILTDSHCRNHIFYPHDRCLFLLLPKLVSWGFKSLRIEGQGYSSANLDLLVSYYRQALEQLRQGKWDSREHYDALLAMFPGGLSVAPMLDLDRY